jgi:hypothetical protein
VILVLIWLGLQGKEKEENFGKGGEYSRPQGTKENSGTNISESRVF